MSQEGAKKTNRACPERMDSKKRLREVKSREKGGF